MTTTIVPPPPESPSVPSQRRWRPGVIVAVAVLLVGAVGVALGVSLTSGSSNDASYSYYQSMMGRFANSSMVGGGSMMGGGSLAGRAGYGWMMGGAQAPGWMHGGSLPSSMMGSSTDPGKVMGQLFADAPGPRVTAAQAAQLGNAVPAGATIDRAANSISFTTGAVHLDVVASPAGGPDETFRIAGLVNPIISVPQNATVTTVLVNADPDTAHGIVVTAAGAANSPMPMMASAPAFSGAALWFLGNPTNAGMHEGTVTFTASTAGTYQYLCPVPGHAAKGMVGDFIVRS
jgi:rusticyanin